MQRHLTIALAVLVAALILGAVWRIYLPARYEPAVTMTPTSATTAPSPPAAIAAAPIKVAISSPQDAPARPAVAEADPSHEYYYAEDLAGFVIEYTPRAVAGDARAAYFVGQAMHKCWLLVEMYNRTAEAYGEFERCRRFVTADPPLARDGWQMWQARAVAGGDLLAQFYDVSETLAKTWMDQDEVIHHGSVDRGKLRELVDRAAASRDPEVYLTLGFMLSNPTIGDPYESFAWVRFVCDRGYDCRAANPRFGTRDCVDSGYCSADATVYDLWQGIDDPRIVDRARDIAETINRGQVPDVPLHSDVQAAEIERKMEGFRQWRERNPGRDPDEYNSGGG